MIAEKAAQMIAEDAQRPASVVAPQAVALS
jgi:hypothetical protein